MSKSSALVIKGLGIDNKKKLKQIAKDNGFGTIKNYLVYFIKTYDPRSPEDKVIDFRLL